MATNDARREIWQHLHHRITQLSDDVLLELRNSVEARDGWGTHRILEIDGIRVFAKSVVVTQVERDDPFGTHNIHGLPTFYSYGMGSAGFRAGRELALHQSTTQWVLEGACPHFPLTYHHRLLPAGRCSSTVNPEEMDEYIRSWNGDPAIRSLMDARNASTVEFLVIMEFIPNALRDWFPERPDAAPRFAEQMQATGRFLAQRGVVHFDAHGGNVLTDGQDFFLTDYGLGMAGSFRLSLAEKSFLARHRYYDQALLACGLLFPLAGAIRKLSEAEREQLTEPFGDIHTYLLASRIRTLVAEGVLDLPAEFVDLTERFAPVFSPVVEFFSALQSPTKDATFPDEHVGNLLSDEGVWPGS